jgi:uncharacterized repeat protein (TIGR01451 family)
MGRHIRRASASAALVATLLAATFNGLAEPRSPVTMSNVGSPSPVMSGAELTYTITMLNSGGAKISDVVLNDQFNGLGGIGVPPQLQLATTRGTCQQTINGVTCSAGEIEGLGSWVVTIRGQVLAPSGATLNNTATVTGTKSAQNFTTTTTTNVLVGGGGGSLPDLTMTKIGPTSVVVSTPADPSPMTYTLTVSNQGGVNATDVVVVDTVPAGLTSISATGTSLFQCAVAGQTVTCLGGAVNAGANATITINAVAPMLETTLTNTSVVDPENAIAEGNELNNTSALVNTAVIPVPPPAPLSVNITDDPAVITGAGPDPVVPGGNVTFKILATNNASTRADDVMIVLGTQSLEASSVLVSDPPVVTNGTIGQGNGCTVSASEATCRVRSLNPGGTVLMSVTGKVIGFSGSSFISTASLTGNIKNQGVGTTDTELTTIKPYVDLTVTKADSPDPVCARSWPGAPLCGGGLTYLLTVGNSGMNAAAGVVVRDPLPAGTILHGYVAPDFSGGCSLAPATNVVTCSGGVIPPESTKTITLVLVAPPYVGSISNTATVDPNNAIFESDETNNTATAATVVKTGIDLSVVKTDLFDPIAPSGTQTYTIVVENNGPQDAANIRLRDTLPSGTVFRDIIQATNGFTCSHSAGTLECIGGSIRGTESESYVGPNAPPPLGPDAATIKFRLFAQSFEGTMHNEVRVDPDGAIPEINEDNNFAVQDTVVLRGGASTSAFNELTILKTRVSPADPVARNAVVTWKIEVHNDGTDPVSGIIVRDFLPAGSRYIQATGDHMFNCSQVSGYVECRGGQLPGAALGPPVVPAGPATITITSFAPDTPGTYINQAIVDPENLIPEGNEFNNQSSAQILVEDGGNGAFNDLQISKTVSPTPSVTPGGTIDYTIKVWNGGSDAASNVAVRDVLPAGVTFVSATDGGGPGSPFTCGESGGVVDCFGATINGGTTEPTARIINIRVTAPNAIVGLTNEVSVDPGNLIPEGSEQNNTATVFVAVSPVIDLSIKKTGPTTSSQSQPGEYVITMTNEKTGDGQRAEDVVMRDPLPVGLIPLAAEIDPGQENNWACQIFQNPINLVECSGDLDPAQTVVVRIAVFMTAESGKSLDNEACIDPDNLIQENGLGETNNCSTWTTVIVPKSPNLFLNKSASPSAVTPGVELVYTLLLQNIGDASAASPLTVTDSLPSSVTFVDANGSDGWTCSYTAPTVSCQDAGGGLATGASITITIRTTVNDGVSLPITNAANATSPATTTDPGAVSETADHLADNTATVTTSVSGSGFDLVLSVLTDNPDPVSPGQVLKYTAVAVNAGTEEATNVKIAINIPSGGVTFVSADGTNGFNCAAPVSNVITCTGTLPGGGDTTISVGLAVLLSLIPPADLSVTATIDPPYSGHPNGDFAESNEGNNSKTEVTTVTGSACVNCADLVATQLVASPGYTGFGVTTQTFTAQIVNVGDTATALNPATDRLFDVVVYAPTTATFSVGTPTFSDPAFAPLCTTTTVPVAAPFTQVTVSCKGNLGPSQGLTITIPVSGVTGDLVSYIWADPSDLINGSSTPPEFREDNNILIVTVFHF